VKFLLRFTGWATLCFVIAWAAHTGWQHQIGSLGARLAAPPGAEIEVVDLELFYPFDLGIFAALCLASTWVPVRNRLRTVAIGLPLLVVAELLSLVVVFKVLMGGGEAGQATRLADGIIRASGLVSASAAWLYFVGRERLSFVGRQWLGS